MFDIDILVEMISFVFLKMLHTQFVPKGVDCTEKAKRLLGGKYCVSTYYDYHGQVFLFCVLIPSNHRDVDSSM